MIRPLNILTSEQHASWPNAGNGGARAVSVARPGGALTPPLEASAG